MAVILKKVSYEFNFIFKILFGAAKAVGSAQFTFEIRDGGEGVLARMGFDSDIGVRGFAVDFSGYFSIRFTGKEDIQECDRTIFFYLSSKLNARVNCVQAVIEVCQGVCREIAPQTLAAELDNTEDIIHVDGDKPRDWGASLMGDFDTSFHCVYHPQLADRDH